MTVRHGETYHEVAKGETFEVCLAYLSDTKLYRAYGPSLEKMQPLKENSKFSYGWADYSVITDEEMEELLKA
jgi:hypothetical protein